MEAITHEEAKCGSLGNEEWEALVVQRKSAQKAALDGKREYHTALSWLRELCDAVEDAREAVRDEEEAQAEARAAEAAAPAPAPAPATAQSELAEKLAALKLEHEQALAQLAQREAQMRAVLARAPPPREGAVADPAAVGRVFKLSGLTAAEVNGMAASVSQAKTGALWDDASAWDRYEDARRRDASSPDSSPAGSPPPSAPPSPPGSDGYASTQAYDDGEREDEPPPSPPPPLPPPSPAPPLASLPPLVLGTPVTPPPRMRVDESETHIIAPHARRAHAGALASTWMAKAIIIMAASPSGMCGAAGDKVAGAYVVSGTV